MSTKDMATRHDILAEHLYAKVEELKPKYSSAKITGMLVDRGEANVIRMLEDPSYLQQSVSKAASVLGESHRAVADCDDCSLQIDTTTEGSFPANNSELSERLYDAVTTIEPKLASHITGMVLELNEDTISKLLSCDQMLQEAVEKAKLSYLSSEMSASECNNNNTEAESFELGDLIYEKVSDVFPQYAAEITGMLLEMEESSLRTLLTQPKSLQVCIQKAYNALNLDNNT